MTHGSKTPEGNEIRRFSLSLSSIHASNLGLGRLASWADGARLLLSESVTLVAVGFGGQMVAAGHLSVGELVSFLIYADLTARAVRDLLNFRSHLGTIQGTLAPLGELLSRTEPPPPRVAVAPRALLRAITLDNVEFAYATRPASPVLKGLGFEVAAGECLAIVGESGSGKSRTLALMAGFYQPTAGRVLLDGAAPDSRARG